MEQPVIAKGKIKITLIYNWRPRLAIRFLPEDKLNFSERQVEIHIDVPSKYAPMQAEGCIEVNLNKDITNSLSTLFLPNNKKTKVSYKEFPDIAKKIIKASLKLVEVDILKNYSKETL